MNKKQRAELRDKFLGDVIRLHKDTVSVELIFNEGFEPLLYFNLLHLLDQLDAYERVVEAWKAYRYCDGDPYNTLSIDGYTLDDAVDVAVEALEGLEDED